jgi:hypothetical protein
VPRIRGVSRPAPASRWDGADDVRGVRASGARVEGTGQGRVDRPQRGRAPAPPAGLAAARARCRVARLRHRPDQVERTAASTVVVVGRQRGTSGVCDRVGDAKSAVRGRQRHHSRSARRFAFSHPPPSGCEEADSRADPVTRRPCARAGSGHLREPGERRLQCGPGVGGAPGVVGHVARELGSVRGQVEVPVAAQRGQDHLLLPVPRTAAPPRPPRPARGSAPAPARCPRFARTARRPRSTPTAASRRPPARPSRTGG